MEDHRRAKIFSPGLSSKEALSKYIDPGREITAEELSEIATRAVNSELLLAGFRDNMLNDSEYGAVGYSSLVRRFALEIIPELSNFAIFSHLVPMVTVFMIEYFEKNRDGLGASEKEKLVTIGNGMLGEKRNGSY